MRSQTALHPDTKESEFREGTRFCQYQIETAAELSQIALVPFFSVREAAVRLVAFQIQGDIAAVGGICQPKGGLHVAGPPEFPR